MSENNERAIIWLTESHPVSGRAAVLEDDGRSCWLYLCENADGVVIKSVLAYSPIQPVSESDSKDHADEKTAPVLVAEYASDKAVIAERYPDDFSFRWRDDGNALAIAFRDEIIAVISMDERYGSSRAIARSGPFGDPLMMERYGWL